jgi:recombination protein RecA
MFGVNVEELILVKPGYGEEAVDMMTALIYAEDVAVMVADSVAVMISTKELDQSAEKFDVGTSAILIKRLCNKLVLALSEEGKRGHQPAVILVNQTRFKIGVMFGDPETMPGGQTLRFLASLIVRIYGKNLIKKDINPELPAFKETSAIVKKAKVPINRAAFTYDMCVYPHGSLGIGDTDSWSTVKSMMQEAGILKKADKGNGWTLFGKTSPTLVMFQDTYEAEKEFAIKCQTAVIEAHSGQGFLIAAEGAAA